jgi:DNA-directed RNA polymerase specialized sigma24 family protein
MSLVLMDLLSYSSEEAGRLMGVTPTTVRVLASQGRAAVRAGTGADTGGDDDA